MASLEKAAIFRRQKLRGESLSQYFIRDVRPKWQELTGYTIDIEDFIHYLQFYHPLPPPYTVDMVLKAGSLGNGTSFRGNGDIDLIVYINGLNSIDDLINHRQELLESLKTCVQSYGPWRGHLQIEDVTKLAVRCTMNGSKIDLLPAYNLLKNIGSPLYIFLAMKYDSEKRGKFNTGREFSVSLTQLRVDFIQPKPVFVKDAIRLLKRWRQEYNLKIPSYSLELLVVHAWRALHFTADTECVDLFKDCVQMLQNVDSLRVTFDDNYLSVQVEGFFKAPYILDPANPYVNTLEGLDKTGIWDAAYNTFKRMI